MESLGKGKNKLMEEKLEILLCIRATFLCFVWILLTGMDKFGHIQYDFFLLCICMQLSWFFMLAKYAAQDNFLVNSPPTSTAWSVFACMMSPSASHYD